MTDEVTLIMEEKSIKCNKSKLMQESDYFKAMFEGNFVEKNSDNVVLNGVDSKAMDIIVMLLWNESYLFDDEDILVVLQTAYMLQFQRISNIIINRLTELLSTDNCIKIWHLAEQLNITPLYLKAKNIALMEYDIIKDLSCMSELNLLQLCSYLANIYLVCNSELDVFNSAMQWFYEHYNETNINLENKEKQLLNLLSCIDYNLLTLNELKEVMLYPDIINSDFLLKVLQCVYNKKNLQHHLDEDIKFSENVQITANFFLNCKSRSGKQLESPALILSKFSPPYESGINLNNHSENSVDDIQTLSRCILMYDINNEFMNVTNINEQKYKGLEGFQIVGYKELLFLFGGEFSLGRGNWNLNFWVYDTIRERWECKTKMPYGRRHFKSCVVGNYLYILGGTGNFRILQENMYWYNYKENVWSKQMFLPCRGIQMEVCDHNNKLFLLNINNKTGYIFDHFKLNFLSYALVDKYDLLKNISDQFTIFSYKNHIFIKSSTLIEMEFTNNSLNVIGFKELNPITCDNMESVMCDNFLYTLYKQRDSGCITLEKFCLNTKEVFYIFKDVPHNHKILINSDHYVFSQHCKLFSLKHHLNVRKTILVNNISL